MTGRHAGDVVEDLVDVVELLPYGPTVAPPTHSTELPPALDEQPAESTPAGFRTAGGQQVTPPAGRVRPVPFVAIAGVDVAAGPVAGQLQDLMVADDLVVTWGRTEVMAQPTPATAQLTLVDTTRTWATTRDLIGQRIDLRWRDFAVSALQPVMFRGRINAVTLTPRRVVDPATGRPVEVVLIGLTATSILADLANRQPADVVWPAESLATRQARLFALCTGVAGSVIIRPAWNDGQAAAQTVNQTTVLDLLKLLYDSTGADRYTFLPDEQSLQHLPRQDYFGSRTLAQLWWDTPTTGSRRGVYARTLASNLSGQVLPGVALYVDGAGVEGDRTMSKTIGSRLTRASVNYYESTANNESRTITKLVPGIDESVLGQRAAQLQTIHNWTSWADLCASDLRDFAAKEAAAWQLPPMRWDTRRTNGFERLDQAQLLLRGAETTSTFFLQRSVLPGNPRPIFGVMGGRIRYSGGGWQVEWEPRPLSTTLPQHAITWEEIDNGAAAYTVRWRDDPDAADGLHESLTYEDLGHVGRGLAVTTDPADRGWDTYQ